MNICTSGLIAITGMIGVQGCAFLTPPLEHPVIEEKLNSRLFSRAAVGTLSLTPDRRVVLVNFETNRFCAEAPTEVATDFSRILKVAAEADIPAEAKGKIGIATAVAASSAALNPRTQGMQLFLANSYFVCQMYMNKAINERQLLEYQMVVFNSAATLIESELPYLHRAQEEKPSPTKNFAPVDPDELLNDLSKLNGKDYDEPESTDEKKSPEAVAPK